ncbi:3-deoxy-D-manno-octulosonic acid transferase [Taibaiella lutea]|uniref:3-deoxy-D-manno-octulosonic acid transferase n=1 Tax=Taibaiella lutea TaxID=2608001 RepID=UPI00167FE2CF|nr:glycosyltransferase N-terminal domain-containing protein [Taibaiella lutea]
MRLASLFNAKAKLFVQGRKRILKRVETDLKNDERKKVWIHCASLGEFEQGRPIIEAIKEQYPEYSIVLTFFSPSGFEAKKNYEHADHIFYLPLDGKRTAEKFISLINPVCVLFVKYEFWYHYLKTLQGRKIPVILFSAIFQPRHPFFKWYGSLYRAMLQAYTQIFVQDAASAKLLYNIQIRNVQIAGDTRFDRSARVLEMDKSFRTIEVFKENHKLIVAGSTWFDDEALLKKTLKALPSEYKLLLAPHEINDVNISRIQGLFPCESCLWATNEEDFRRSRVCIIHTMGQLSYLYKYADVIWVGGGFTRSGIHNVIEPAVFGKPIFFGPTYDRYREAVEMIEINAAKSISSANEFTNAILNNKNALLQLSNNAKMYVLAQLGATKRIMDYLAEKCFSNKA